MTMDEDGEREASKASEAPMPKQRQTKAKGKPLKTRRAMGPKRCQGHHFGRDKNCAM